MNIVYGKGISKQFGDNDEERTILDDVSIEIHKGEFVTIMGPSGSGKSTLMYALSGMDRVDSGDVFLRSTR